jgi:pteridine reductase
MSRSPLAGRRALVTGGAVRVGRRLALELAAMGFDVAVHHRSSDAEAEGTAADCRARGVAAAVVQADLSGAGGCRACVDDAETALGGGIDVLVNSAANFLAAPFGETTEEQVDLALAVNLKAPFLLAQAVAPGMAERGFGRIVNMADVAGLEPWPRFVAHSAAKAGVVMLTRSLAQELAPAVTVNAIAPGTVLMPEGASEAAARRAREKTVLDRIGSPDDVAGALRYLLEADYVTGHTLVVDGGRLVRP